MANGILATSDEIEARVIRLAERPIEFDEFLDLNIDNDMELINGVMVQKMAAQWDHEKLLAWLFTLMYLFAKQKNLGTVLGSRTPVQIDRHRGRMPDLLFVRQENSAIIQQKGVYGVPDLVVELVSPNDRPSDIVAVETDYRAIGVPMIVFVDQQKRRVRLLHKREDSYDETLLMQGALVFAAVPGFVLQIEWLFAETRPDELALLTTLLSA